MLLERIDVYRDRVESILKSEYSQILFLTFLSVSAPLFIKSPQLLVGTVVNFALFFSARAFGFKKSLPSILLPSLIAFSSNILFGGATYFLIFFVPIIFLGNSVYVLLSRYIKGGVFSVVISSVSKSLLLFIFAFLFVNEFGLPQIFLSSMGVIQLATGVLGGGMGLFLNKNLDLRA